MLDNTFIPLSRLLIGMLSIAGVSLVVITSVTSIDLGALGLLLCTCAAVLVIRELFARDRARQRRAFLLGRESMRTDERSGLHSVDD